MIPLFVLLAGPNGSGKSTLARSAAFRALNLAVVNPDTVALEAPADVNALIWAGREVRRRIDALTAERTSFAVETTLSGNNHLRTISACRRAGMHLALHFVFVRDIALAKGRVRTRVGMDGHDVPEADQERRFSRSIAKVATIVPLMDESYFYDNSDIAGHQLVAEFLGNRPLHVSVDAPDWLNRIADG